MLIDDEKNQQHYAHQLAKAIKKAVEVISAANSEQR